MSNENILSGLNFTNGYGSINGLPVNTKVDGKNTVEFWMYWKGVSTQMPFGFDSYDLYFVNGHFGFNTANADLFGISSTGLVNTWIHVAAIFNNGNIKNNKLYINGILQNLTQRLASPLNRTATSYARISGWPTNETYKFTGSFDEIRIWNYERSQSQIVENMNKILNIENNDDTSGLIANWRLDEGTGSVSVDNSISKINLGLNGTYQWITDTPILQGYYRLPNIIFESDEKLLYKDEFYNLKYKIEKPSTIENSLIYQMTEYDSTDSTKTYIFNFNKKDWDTITNIDIW